MSVLDSAWGMHRHVEMHVPYSRQVKQMSVCQYRTALRGPVGTYLEATVLFVVLDHPHLGPPSAKSATDVAIEIPFCVNMS